MYTGYDEMVGFALDDARSDDADPRAADEFHGDPRGGVAMLQVRDQLRHVLDRVPPRRR